MRYKGSNIIINPNLFYMKLFERVDNYYDYKEEGRDNLPTIFVPKEMFDIKGMKFIGSVYGKRDIIQVKVKFPYIDAEGIKEKCNVSFKFAYELSKKLREEWKLANMRFTDETFKHVYYDPRALVFNGEPIIVELAGYMSEEDMNKWCLPDGTLAIIRL